MQESRLFFVSLPSHKDGKDLIKASEKNNMGKLALILCFILLRKIDGVFAGNTEIIGGQNDV